MTTGFLPLAEGHNGREALTQYFSFGGANELGDKILNNYHCDESYTPVTGNPWSEVLPQGCVYNCVNVLYTGISCTSPLTAASVVYDEAVKFNLDCAAGVTFPPIGFAFRSVVGSNNGGSASCERWFSANQPYGDYFLDHGHWSRNHGLLPHPTPIAMSDTMHNKFEVVDSPMWSNLTALHVWFHSSAPIPLTAYLADGQDDSIFHSNDAVVHHWNITDPGGDDLLYQNGLDITPQIGGTVSLGLGLTIKREDAGGGDVLWRLKSTMDNKYLVVSKDINHQGNRVWNFYAVST